MDFGEVALRLLAEVDVWLRSGSEEADAPVGIEVAPDIVDPILPGPNTVAVEEGTREFHDVKIPRRSLPISPGSAAERAYHIPQKEDVEFFALRNPECVGAACSIMHRSQDVRPTHFCPLGTAV